MNQLKFALMKKTHENNWTFQEEIILPPYAYEIDDFQRIDPIVRVEIRNLNKWEQLAEFTAILPNPLCEYFYLRSTIPSDHNFDRYFLRDGSAQFNPFCRINPDDLKLLNEYYDNPKEK